MCMHPHGIIPLQAMVWSAYCDQYFSDPITGDTLYGFGAAADVVKYLPFIKNIMGWLSAGSANYDVLKRGLDEGIAEQCNVNNNRKPRHLFLLPGGVAEVFESTVGHNAIVFKNRRGLVKLAIETGSDLLPCYVFGGTDFYHNIATGTGILSRISRKMKAGVTIFYGWFFLPLPFLPKVTLCVADPIRVEKVEGEIPKELIESIHKEYIEAIKELFEKYKVKAGYPDAVLDVK
ncbi:hypothetical protein TL16_g02228 [Triparma laevis f. inornata]|nr:hypothetical protein TL16_g02228 [Triparma laevis f. inornata]